MLNEMCILNAEMKWKCSDLKCVQTRLGAGLV